MFFNILILYHFKSPGVSRNKKFQKHFHFYVLKSNLCIFCVLLIDALVSRCHDIFANKYITYCQMCLFFDKLLHFFTFLYLSQGKYLLMLLHDFINAVCTYYKTALPLLICYNTRYFRWIIRQIKTWKYSLHTWKFI